MGRVLTNTITLEVATETSLGVQPTTGWRTVEPNSIGKFGPALKKIAREPISKNRQRRKGALVDLDSTVEFEMDLTYDHLKMFVEGLFFATAKGTPAFAVTGVTATGYTVASGGALAQNTLVFARGFTNAANNGLKVLGAGSIATEIRTGGLVVEAAPPLGATVEIAGVQGAVADFTINAAGNLTSTAFNWLTGTSLQVGQFIFIGDLAAAANSFATAADRGLARIKAITATIVTLEKKATVFTVDAGTGKNINVLFGQYIRNVGPDVVSDYLERTFQFELGYENLQVPGPGDEYEYAVGNFVNEITFDFPVASKAVMKCSFVGLTTANPTVTRATGAATPIPIIAEKPMNTSVDMLRLRVTNVDETGITTDFKSMTLVIKNNVSPEKVLATLGGKYVNAGLFDVEITANVLFTSDLVIIAMRDNRQVTFDMCVRNDDGAFVFDVPAMTIEGGDKQFPINQTVSIQMKSMAFQDPLLGTSCSVSTFPYMPAS